MNDSSVTRFIASQYKLEKSIQPCYNFSFLSFTAELVNFYPIKDIGAICTRIYTFPKICICLALSNVNSRVLDLLQPREIDI